MRHLLGNKRVTAGRQVDKGELESFFLSFFFSHQKISVYLNFPNLPQNLGFMDFMLASL